MPHISIIRIAVHDEKDNLVCLATLGEVTSENGAPLNAILKQFDIKSVIGPPRFYISQSTRKHTIVVPVLKQKRAAKHVIFKVQGVYLSTRFPKNPINVRCAPHPEAMSIAFAAALEPYFKAEKLERLPGWPDMPRDMHVSRAAGGVHLFNYVACRLT